MRFLVEKSTGPAVAEWLTTEGYEIFSVYDTARGMNDDDIVKKAFDENWILITNDKDFGEQVDRERKPHHGIVLLRLENERAHSDSLPEQFVVVTEKSVRFAKQD